MALTALSIPGLGVKIAVQVIPPSLEVRVLKLPLDTVTSALLNPVTASLKRIVTKLVSPILRATSLIEMVAVGPEVSMVTE